MNDIYYSTGGAPEGVVLRSALVLWRSNSRKISLNEEEKLEQNLVLQILKKYNIDDMIKGDVIFCATGVTSDLAKGVKDLGNEFEVNIRIT